MSSNIPEEYFAYIIETNVLPLIPVALKGNIICKSDLDQYSIKPNDKIVQIIDFENTRQLLFAPHQNKTDYYYKAPLSPLITTSVSISTATQVLEEILSTIRRTNLDFSYSGSKFYLNSLCNTATTIGICKKITPSQNNAYTLVQIISALEKWALKTYEGRKIPFGIIVDFNQNTPQSGCQNYIDFLDSKYSATFTDGVFSAIILNSVGQILQHVALPNPNSIKKITREKLTKHSHKQIISPERFKGFSELCGQSRIGCIALSSGDILLIQGQELSFAKREGTWIEYGYSAFFRPCMEPIFLFSGTRGRSNATVDRLAKCVYLSILDASFAHTGACIAVVDFRKNSEELKDILHNCLIDEDLNHEDSSLSTLNNAQFNSMKMKQDIIRQLVSFSRNKKKQALSFSSLSNKLRTEFLGMDGAVIIDRRGIVRSVGAILTIKPGSEEGGRMAAARKLSDYGVAIKVSEDGGITGLWKGKIVFHFG